MSLWNILVMGVLRLDLNWGYDRLQEQVDSHKTIRQMLGHADARSVIILQEVKKSASARNKRKVFCRALNRRLAKGR